MLVNTPMESARVRVEKMRERPDDHCVKTMMMKMMMMDL